MPQYIVISSSILFSSFLKDRLGDMHTNFPMKSRPGEGYGVLRQQTESVLLLCQGGKDREETIRVQHVIKLGCPLETVAHLQRITDTDGRSEELIVSLRRDGVGRFYKAAH